MSCCPMTGYAIDALLFIDYIALIWATQDRYLAFSIITKKILKHTTKWRKYKYGSVVVNIKTRE